MNNVCFDSQPAAAFSAHGKRRLISVALGERVGTLKVPERKVR